MAAQAGGEGRRRAQPAARRGKTYKPNGRLCRIDLIGKERDGENVQSAFASLVSLPDTPTPKSSGRCAGPVRWHRAACSAWRAPALGQGEAAACVCMSAPVPPGGHAQELQQSRGNWRTPAGIRPGPLLGCKEALRADSGADAWHRGLPPRAVHALLAPGIPEKQVAQTVAWADAGSRRKSPAWEDRPASATSFHRH